MIETKSTINCKSVWDDKKQHRYSFEKEWDSKKPKVLVISKSAGIDDGIEQTLTQMIITNNLYDLGFGGFTLCNLISDINGSNAVSAENIKTITEYIKSKELSGVIICWGSDEKFPDFLKEEADKVTDIIKKAKKENVFRISDGETANFCHPLSPKVRNNFFLTPVQL